MRVLITGGAGYIGTHCVVELIRAGHHVEIVDNFLNSSPAAIGRTESIIGVPLTVHRLDICDQKGLDALFAARSYQAVIHLAGLKSVADSVREPIEYYQNNIVGSLRLLAVMHEHQVHRLVVSSSATVYGTATELPLTENSTAGLGIQNPYGRTKFMLEQIVTDAATADPRWQITVLRYFNPIGAHSSGLIGEDPVGVPSNLVPFVAQVAAEVRPVLTINGLDYPTPDGTCVRDYIHVMDLADAHAAALQHSAPGVQTYNLGTGAGVSVLQIVSEFERISGKPIPCVTGPRRPGDVASSYTDPTKARRELGWSASRTLHDSLSDVWRWQSENPAGYPLVGAAEGSP